MKACAARRLALFALLATSARLLLAEDDVDRTDFSEAHLKEDSPASPLAPSTEVASVALLPGLAVTGSVPVGVDTILLVALSNLGSRMYNVTNIDGYLLEAASGKKLEVFKKQTYGEALNPREQRSFRYAFGPSAERTLGDYRLIFSAYYTNKDKDPFMDVVYNETAQLVAAPVSDEDMMMLYAAAVAVPLLLVALCMFCCKASSAEAASSKAAKSGAKDSKDAISNEWLQNTSAASEGKVKKAKRA
jgi:hypothetical protein